MLTTMKMEYCLYRQALTLAERERKKGKFIGSIQTMLGNESISEKSHFDTDNNRCGTGFTKCV